MAANQEEISQTMIALSHPLRRDVLLYLHDNEECSFTDLLNDLSVDTGKLSFHLRNLAPFLEQTPRGRYRLSKIGRKAVALIMDVQGWGSSSDTGVGTTRLSLASFKDRAAAFFIDFGIAFLLFIALPNIFFPFIQPSSILSSSNIMLFLILFWIYLTLLEGFSGQSIGKRIVEIRVVRIDGKRVLYDHAAIRNFGKVFLLPVDLLLGLRLKDKRFMTYFDKFTDTTVIKI